MRHLEKICLYSLTAWLVGCSSGFNADGLSGAGSSSQSKASKSNTAKPEDAIASVNSEQAKVGEDEVPVDSAVTAVPPQMVTGAYLVCAPVSSADTQAMNELPETLAPTENKIYSCGIQTIDRLRHPAQTSITEVQVQCANEEDIWPPEMVAASPASTWNAYFQVPMARTCEVERILVEVVINGENVRMETKLSDPTMPMPPPNYHLLFVTSEVYGIGKDGISGSESADKFCSNLAKDSPITSFNAKWKAILSDEQNSVKSRVTITQNVLSTAEQMPTLFDITSSSSFWKGIHAAVATETGALLSDSEEIRVWTGSKDDGNKSDKTCQNWTSGKAGDSGKFGKATEVNSGDWIAKGDVGCDQKLRLYCISQPLPAGQANPQAIQATTK